MKIINSHDFRYATTLRFNFNNIPLGGASYGFESDHEIKKFHDIGCTYSFKLLLKCIELGDNINSIFKKHLRNCRGSNSEIILDWRDDLELEIHNVDSSKFHEENINLIEKDLKLLVFNIRK